MRIYIYFKISARNLLLMLLEMCKRSDSVVKKKCSIGGVMMVSAGVGVEPESWKYVYIEG